MVLHSSVVGSLYKYRSSVLRMWVYLFLSGGRRQWLFLLQSEGFLFLQVKRKASFSGEGLVF